MVFLCNIANVAQRTFEIIQKPRSRKHGDIIISTRMHVDGARASPRTSTCEVPRDFKEVAADFVCDNGILEVSLLHV